MFVLRNESTGNQHILGTRSIIGRSRAADLHIASDDVSGEHAAIWWDGRSWKIRDLASRNGTLVDGDQVEPGKSMPLSAGQCIQFGTVDSWAIDTADPPVPAARDLIRGTWTRAAEWWSKCVSHSAPGQVRR